MICWTVTAFTDDLWAYPIIEADAAPSLTEARLSAGDAAIATLTHLVTNAHGRTVYLSVTIDDHTPLAGGVTADRSAAAGLAQLVDEIHHMQRQIRTAD